MVEVRPTKRILSHGFRPSVRERCIERKGCQVAQRVADGELAAVRGIHAHDDFVTNRNAARRLKHVRDDERPSLGAATHRNIVADEQVRSVSRTDDDVDHRHLPPVDEDRAGVRSLIGPSAVDGMRWGAVKQNEFLPIAVRLKVQHDGVCA
ncbi:hypothetical protein GCM10027415_28570 [Humibacter ginsengisoli]